MRVAPPPCATEMTLELSELPYYVVIVSLSDTNLPVVVGGNVLQLTRCPLSIAQHAAVYGDTLRRVYVDAHRVSSSSSVTCHIAVKANAKLRGAEHDC